MSQWDYSIFEEKLGNKIEYGVLNGQTNAGKTTLATTMKNSLDFQVIDMKVLAEKIKASMVDEDGNPFEGEIPVETVEKEVVKIISASKGSAERKKFVFDGFLHKDAASIIQFLDQFGFPTFWTNLTASEKSLKDRFCKKEGMDDFPEDQQEVLAEQTSSFAAMKDELHMHYVNYSDRITISELSTDNSLETTKKELTSKFSPQVIILNHEKRLGIDTTCANLAIKYNMIYISVYQIIKYHIENKTNWGTDLMQTKRKKVLNLTT